MKKTTKHRFYLTYAFIILATLSEWSGIALNGAPEWTAGIHSIVKCIDYIITPMVGACFGFLVSDEKERKKHIWIAVVLGANAVLEVISVFTGWTFYVNEQNYYCHGPLYFVYALVYCITLVYILFSFRAYSKNFKRQNKTSLYAIILLTFMGIGFQEFGDGNIRTSCLTLAFGSALLFIHYNEFLQQRNDDNLVYQKNLVETDALTGLLSRYSYIKTLDEYNRREGIPQRLVVFSIDINGLKRENDMKGHSAGDLLICTAAECILEVFGRYGKCFRIGGDEFIAIINIEKKKIADLCKSFSDAQGRRKGLSLASGFAAAEDHPELTVEELANIADKMMYIDKVEHYKNKE
ncbi:MAG: GGDEF domain-containing protein [Oscillospiraceae bacterium]|nr:GGDEF domain-containing protein [Oscillospiraceae bacterium]